MEFKVGDRVFQRQFGKAKGYRTTGAMREWKLYGTVRVINPDGRLRIEWTPRGKQARKWVSLPPHCVELATK